MSAFTRTERRLLHTGVQLTRSREGCDPGKWPVSINVRSTVAGTITARAGMVAVQGALFGEPIHTLVRFDDATPFAADGSLYFIGSGTNVYSGDTCGGSYPSVDSGYSGDPLSFATATPPQSPQPWLYVADPSRNRKFDANGHNYRMGILPPRDEPATELQAVGINIIERFESGYAPWVPIGTNAVSGVVVQRVNTTVSSVLYDLNVAPSYASIVPAVPDGITEGMLITVGSQTIAVTQVTIAVAPTTVAAIQFDSGTSGMCTIQPAASLGTGQLEGPSLQDYQTRFGVPYAVPVGTAPGGTGTNLPPTPTANTVANRVRLLDFPRNCVINLGGELVRIHNVAIGLDETLSFRCFTMGSHSVGETITGVSAFRGWAASTISSGDAVTDSALTFKLSTLAPVSPATTYQSTGGMRTVAGWPAVDLALINGRATLPADYVYLAIRVDDFTLVDTVRLYLSMEPTAGTAPDNTVDFTQNYFFHEWRQSDLATAIQTINSENVGSLTSARTIAQSNAITDQPVPMANGRPITTSIVVNNNTGKGYIKFTTENYLALQRTGQAPGTANASADAIAQQLMLGDNQWIPLTCKISDLIQIGTDPTKTLGNITAAEVLVSMTTKVASTVTVNIDGIWIAGGYALDSGTTGVPYAWRYRYRSSATGARSVGSPPTRGGVAPKRQAVSVTGVTSSDPQVDLIDYFRQGGNLANYTYCGSMPNGSPAFLDVFADNVLDGGETLEDNLYPPFPCEDIPHTGTCNTAGSSITWVSGDQFDTNWQAGSLITINNQTYSLYGPPPSATRMFVNENIGAFSGTPFVVKQPTVIDKPFGSVWAGTIEGISYLFGCRDPINPGVVHWSNGNDTETASDANALPVTDASEPLQAGYMWDGLPYVASTEQIYRLSPTFGASPAGGVPSQFAAQVTPCGRGFWTPWAWCLAPEGVYFVARDGIFLTSGGSPAVSITDADLYPLFPHDGIQGQAVNGYQPVAMAPSGNCATPSCATPVDLSCALTLNPGLRLVYIDGWVKFDYQDVTGNRCSLCYHVETKAWYPDITTPGIAMRWGGQGGQVHQEVIGGQNGQVYLSGGATDNCEPIICQAELVDNQNDIRRMKLYRDLFLKGDLTGATPRVTIGFTDNDTTLTPTTLTGLTGLQDYLIDTVPQTGIYGTNLTLALRWVPASPVLPQFESIDIAFQPGPELASSWLSGPTTLGSSGFKQIPRALICYISNGPVTLSVIIDGVLYTYSLPSTAGGYLKNQVVLQSVKGKCFQFGMQGAPFQLFDKDVEIWTQPWGQTQGYQILRPF